MSEQSPHEPQKTRSAEASATHPRAELIGKDDRVLAAGTVVFTQAGAHREQKTLVYFQPEECADLKALRAEAKILRFRDVDLPIVGTRDGGLGLPEQIQLYLDMEG